MDPQSTIGISSGEVRRRQGSFRSERGKQIPKSKIQIKPKFQGPNKTTQAHRAGAPRRIAPSVEDPPWRELRVFAGRGWGSDERRPQSPRLRGDIFAQNSFAVHFYLPGILPAPSFTMPRPALYDERFHRGRKFIAHVIHITINRFCRPASGALRILLMRTPPSLSAYGGRSVGWGYILLALRAWVVLFGPWILDFGFYLDFGFWTLEFDFIAPFRPQNGPMKAANGQFSGGKFIYSLL